MAAPRRVALSPSNWFEARSHDLGTSAVAAAPPASAGDSEAWTRLALEELRAVHRTWRAWHDAAAQQSDAATTAALTAALDTTRAALEARSAAVLAGGDAAGDVALAFPTADHSLLADTATALGFLREFLHLRDGQSLTVWTRALATSDDIVARATAHAWPRLLLQKAAAERDLPKAADALRAIYADRETRARLRRDDTATLTAANLEWCGWWATALGLDAGSRGAPAIPVAARRTAPPGTRADVTVVIPSYNHAAFIDGTLASVLGQSHTALRALVVDDRSSDDTAARARAVDDPRLQVEVNATNRGLGDSVLAALERVETPFVALLNSDDVFHPERLARCLDAFDRTPAAQVVATGVVPIDTGGARLTPDTVSRLFDGRHIADWVRWHADRCQVPEDADVLAELLERNFLITSSNIVARTEFLRRHAADLRGLKYCLDWQVFLDAALDRALVVLRDELLGYRLHATNTVWFDEARAVSYRVEVNRVLLSALKAVAARTSNGPETMAQGLDSLVRHAARHSEAAGFTMAAVDLWGGALLEARSQGSASVHDLLRDLTRPLAAGASPADAAEARRLSARALAAEVAAEMARDAQAAAEAAAADLRNAHRETAREAAAHAAALDDERRRHDDTRRDAAATVAQAEAEAARARHDAAAEIAALAATHAAAVAQLKSAPEWLLGDRLWNRARLSHVGEPAVRALHAWRDRRNRWGLALRGLARRAGVARPGAIVTACWSFPIHSQTFVYQEMTALAWTGLDTRVFCGIL